MTPFIPSSPVGRLELLSDLPSSTDQRMKDIDEMLMAQDRIGPPPPTVSKGGSQMSDIMLLDDDELGQIYSPLRGANEETSYSSPSRHVRASDRKVEGPLTPPMTVAPQNIRTKSISFPEILQEVIPDLPPPIEKRPDELSSQADLDTFFEGTIAPIAEKVNSALEQEQLQEKDSTLRVDVPIMDFSLPTPPWEKYSKTSSRQGLEEQTEQKPQERLLTEIKERHLNLKTHLWSGASRVERELYWTPFPADLGKVALEEAIDDDDGETVATFLADFHRNDIIDSGSLTWKPEGLRILRDDDEDTDEEELQPGTFREEQDIVSMIKKRKLELRENTLDSPPEEGRQDKAPKMDFTQTSLLSGTFSAFNHLSNFVEIRSGLSKKEKLTESPHFPSKAPEPTTRATSSTEKIPGLATAERTKSPIQPDRPPLSVPRTPLPTTSHPFIISSTLLMQKTLTRRIETLYPSAELIERDWTAHTPAPPRGTSKPLKIPTPNPLNDEADLLISPSTGLILITLQKLKQRPLPGQVQRSAIRERIARVAPRYERLVVFVSEGRNIGDSGTAGMMGDDCEAVLEFMGFAASLKDEAEVRYIAGGEEDLAAWVVGYMVKYGMTNGEVKLLQDETLWELFLRRAGMNAYAAQVVLSELRAPDEDQTKQEGQSQQADFGLTKFVKMGVETWMLGGNELGEDLLELKRGLDEDKR
ncbi:MAG: hypothetical protein M1836_006189 [Candelina mexicana]|nr:MAG: hypothetical protein M1836_006189 [Candelina mexicana]